jgi:hypothetical protein
MGTTVQDSNIADKSPAWDGDARIHRPVQGSWLLVVQPHLSFCIPFLFAFHRLFTNSLPTLQFYLTHPSYIPWWPNNLPTGTYATQPVADCLILE